MKRSFTSYTKGSLPGWIKSDAKQQGGSPPHIVFGIKDNEARICNYEQRQWLYLDHAYFKRGWDRSNFRAVRNGLHVTRLLGRPTDRIDLWGVKIEPWRKTGTEIVLIPPTGAQTAYYCNEGWLMQTISRLEQITARPVATKWGKLSSLREFCKDAWAVVTYASVAGVEAALMGIPVFSTEHCPSWPVCAGKLEDIETPEYSDARLEMAAGLTYASWNAEEMHKVKWVDYQYEMLCA